MCCGLPEIILGVSAQKAEISHKWVLQIVSFKDDLTNISRLTCSTRNFSLPF